MSFNIRKGTTFGLVGESGSGKSTVARMIAGLTRPTSGTILFDGVDKWSAAAQTVAMRRRFQMIFQDPYASLNPRWTVEQLIAEPLVVLGITQSKEETAERVQQALHRVRMKPDDAKSTRTSSPAANASASPWRAHWPAGRSSSFVTSPPRRWTYPCRPRCST